MGEDVYNVLRDPGRYSRTDLFSADTDSHRADVLLFDPAEKVRLAVEVRALVAEALDPKAGVSVPLTDRADDYGLAGLGAY